MKFLNPEDYLNFGEDSAKDSEFEEKIKEYDEYFSTKIKKMMQILLHHFYIIYFVSILQFFCKSFF